MAAALRVASHAASVVWSSLGASLGQVIANLGARADGNAAILALVSRGAGAEAIAARAPPRAAIPAPAVLAGPPEVQRRAKALAGSADAASGAGSAGGIGRARGLRAALSPPAEVALALGLVGAPAVVGASVRAHAPRACRSAPPGIALACGGAPGAEHASATP